MFKQSVGDGLNLSNNSLEFMKSSAKYLNLTSSYGSDKPVETGPKEAFKKLTSDIGEDLGNLIKALEGEAVPENVTNLVNDSTQKLLTLKDHLKTMSEDISNNIELIEDPKFGLLVTKELSKRYGQRASDTFSKLSPEKKVMIISKAVSYISLIMLGYDHSTPISILLKGTECLSTVIELLSALYILSESTQTI